VSTSELRASIAAKTITSSAAKNSQPPVFTFKKDGADEAGNNIWALLEPTGVSQAQKNQELLSSEESKDSSALTAAKKKRKNKQKKKNSQAIADQQDT